MTNFMSNSIFFGAALSLIAYEVGLLLKRKFKMAIFNPLLIAIIAVIAVYCILIMTPIIRAVSISAICSHLRRSAWQFRCISRWNF